MKKLEGQHKSVKGPKQQRSKGQHTSVKGPKQKRSKGQQRSVKGPKQKRSKRSLGLSSVLFSHTKGKMLALLFNNEDRRYYLRDMANEVGISIGSVNPALQEMVHAGIIDVNLEGRKKFYSINRFCPIYEELKNLVLKTVGVVEPIRDALEPLRDRIDVAFIFGSVATGEDTGRSDIDIMVIGQLSLRQISAATYPLEKKIGREVNPHVYSPERFTTAYNENNHFIRSIVKTKLLFLTGSQNDLRRLAGESLVGETADVSKGNKRSHSDDRKGPGQKQRR